MMLHRFLKLEELSYKCIQVIMNLKSFGKLLQYTFLTALSSASQPGESFEPLVNE